MMFKRSLFFLLACLIAVNFARVNAEPVSTAAGSGKAARTVVRDQSAAPISVTLVKGAPQVKTTVGPVLSGMKLRLHFADNSTLVGDFELLKQNEETVKASAFERLRYRLIPASSSQPVSKAMVNAVLEMRHYHQPDVIVASLEYDGPALAATDGIQLIMTLDGFARGMALKQLKLYWTSPVFVSDHRLLSPANQLLLWKQIQGDDYHLIVPLAGDGMVGTIGVSEIDYRYEFRVSSSSQDPAFAPHRIPLFAYSTSNNPYQLPRDVYRTAFAASEQYGKLRWEKSYPEVFRSLGWCSWNTYYKEVTADKVLNSIRSLRDQKIPIGFVLVDDGWLSVKENKLTDFAADPVKFPQGLEGLAKTLREEYKIPHIGVWHTFQGYWDGVDKSSGIGQTHKLFTGIGGKSLPDPRERAGEGFYADWYSRLKKWGYDFVKVDNQGSNGKFTNGLLPLFASGGGSQHNLQEAARKYFSDTTNVSAGQSAGLNLINCMEMSLEGAFNWRFSNLARNSNDYEPDSPQNAKEHVYQNAYNAYWTANFAYPDWDMFQSHDPSAEFHAVARAISGGPVYFTDEPGKERPEILRRLAFSDGRLLMLDEPGQVTRDLLLTDTGLEAVPLKLFGRISRPEMNTGMIAAFNVNKSAQRVAGAISAADVDGLIGADKNAAAARVAVYRRSDERVSVLDAARPTLPVLLNGNGFDLFTLAPIEQGIAVFGLLDKYMGAAAIISVSRQRNQFVVRLREAGDFGAWMEFAPAKVELNKRTLPITSYSYSEGLLRIPQSSFGNRTGEHELRIIAATRTR